MPATSPHGGFDLCECCGSEGRLYHMASGWSEPYEVDDGECPCCEGTGREWHEDEMCDDEDWTEAVSDMETLCKLYLELANVVPGDCDDIDAFTLADLRAATA